MLLTGPVVPVLGGSTECVCVVADPPTPAAVLLARKNRFAVIRSGTVILVVAPTDVDRVTVLPSHNCQPADNVVALKNCPNMNRAGAPGASAHADPDQRYIRK